MLPSLLLFVPALAAPHQDVSTDDREAATIEAIRRADYDEARRLLDLMIVDDARRSARALLAEGQGLQAISTVDRALEVSTITGASRAGLLTLRGDAAFAAASSDFSKAPMFGEAHENYESASRAFADAGQPADAVAAILRASRAARLLGESQLALDESRAAMRWIDTNAEAARALVTEQPPTRTWAEAAFARYAEVARDALASENVDPEVAAERDALFAETRTALDRTIGRFPTNTWAFGELAKLHQWAGDVDSAASALEAALALAPNDEATHNAFIRVIGDRAEAAARRIEGTDDVAAAQARSAAVLARYDQFRATYPENALGHWYSGYETFWAALRKFEAGEPELSRFQIAETMFAACRERAPSYAGACVDYEILCRLGVGWCHYTLERDDEAVQAFLSTEALRPAGSPQVEAGRTPGLDMQIAGAPGSGARLPSALAGMSFVIQRLISDPSDPVALTRAAAISDVMFEARSDRGNLANDAGFLNRDAAVLWETVSRRALSRASTDEEKAQALELRDRADALMAKSWAAYQVAAALLPDDVRVVNDAGLVMAYYVRTDAEAAERYFLDSIEDGAVQLEAPTVEGEALAALNEAWGDAHQNMGIIEWTMRSNPKAAKAWFEKALEIGPPSRNWLRDVLPMLDQWAASGEEPADLVALERTQVWTHNP